MHPPMYRILCTTLHVGKIPAHIVIDESIDEAIKQICVNIEHRYEWILFLEIETDKDHVRFLIF